jgi:hypothetical protein
MWKCKKCGEGLEDSFDSCWRCNTPDDGTSPRLAATPESWSDSPSSSSRAGHGSSPAVTSSAAKRYSDAYLVARSIAGIGELVKVAAFILGGCIIFAAITQDRATFVIGGFILAFGVAIPIYVLGILVAAQGQILKATLDTAVTNSPFLKREDMAKVMSL